MIIMIKNKIDLCTYIYIYILQNTWYLLLNNKMDFNLYKKSYQFQLFCNVSVTKEKSENIKYPYFSSPSRLNIIIKYSHHKISQSIIQLHSMNIFRVKFHLVGRFWPLVISFSTLSDETNNSQGNCIKFIPLAPTP